MAAKLRDEENFNSRFYEQENSTTGRQDGEFEPSHSHTFNSATIISDFECEQTSYHTKDFCQMRHTVASNDTTKGQAALNYCHIQHKEASSKCCETSNTAGTDKTIDQRLTSDAMHMNSRVMKQEVCNDAVRGNLQIANVPDNYEAIKQEVCDYNIGLNAPDTKESLIKDTRHRKTQMKGFILEGECDRNQACSEQFRLKTLEPEQLLVICENTRQPTCGGGTQYKKPQAEQPFIKKEINDKKVEDDAFRLEKIYPASCFHGGQLKVEILLKDAGNCSGSPLCAQAISESLDLLNDPVPRKDPPSPSRTHRLCDTNIKVEAGGEEIDLEIDEKEEIQNIKAETDLSQYDMKLSGVGDGSYIMQADREAERFCDAVTMGEPDDDQPLLEPLSLESRLISTTTEKEYLPQAPGCVLNARLILAKNVDKALEEGCFPAKVKSADEFAYERQSLLPEQLYIRNRISQKPSYIVLDEFEQAGSTTATQKAPLIHEEDSNYIAPGLNHKWGLSAENYDYKLHNCSVLHKEKLDQVLDDAQIITHPPNTSSSVSGAPNTSNVNVDPPSLDEHKNACLVPPILGDSDAISRVEHLELKRRVSNGHFSKVNELLGFSNFTATANNKAYLDNHTLFGTHMGSDKRLVEVKCEPTHSDQLELPPAKRRKRSSRRLKDANCNEISDMSRALDPSPAFRNVPEIIDISHDTAYKYYCRPAHVFPRFKEGDVSLSWLNKGERYTYQLHSNILARYSPWFAKTLKEVVQEPSAKLAATLSHSTGIKFRYEMKLDAESKSPNLLRASLTEFVNPSDLLPNGLDGAGNLVSTPENASRNCSETTPGHLNSTSGDFEDQNLKHDYFEAYDNLLRIIYAIGPLIAKKNISKAFYQAQALIHIANFCGSLRLVRPFINSSLCQYGQDLYASICVAPLKWLQLGSTLECETIFREALVHAVGRCDEGALSSVHPGDLPASVERLYYAKVNELSKMQDIVQHDIINSSIYVDGNPIDPDDHDSSVRNTLRVVKMWHKDYHMCLAQINKSRFNNFDNRIYHVLRRGGDSYLPVEEVLDQLRWENDCQLSCEDEMQACEDLAEMKRFAQKIVEPLLVNRSMLDPREAGIEYLTCIKVRRDEMPWMQKPSC